MLAKLICRFLKIYDIPKKGNVGIKLMESGASSTVAKDTSPRPLWF